MKVYMLWFEQEQDEFEDIGLYETEAEANAAIERRKDKPGFVDFPGGFKIYERELGLEGWAEGSIRETA
jgi:hypothetical protein